jgi:hypothetical protein
MRWMDTSSEFSLQMGRPNSANRAASALVPVELLCCVARNQVVGFDFASGECLGAIARLPQLNGQALVFFPVVNRLLQSELVCKSFCPIVSG